MKGLSVILTVLLLVVASQLPGYLKKAQIAPEKDLPANRESSQTAQTRPLFATFAKDPQQKIN